MGAFRDFGATNEPHTCLWCGRKLRRKQTKVARIVETKRTEPKTIKDEKWGYDKPDPAGGTVEKIVKETEYVGTGEFTYGDYGDDKFCGLSCGYCFAVDAATAGYRFQPAGKQDGDK